MPRFGVVSVQKIRRIDTLAKRTPLYSLHTELGGRIVDFAGWDMPVDFGGVVKDVCLAYVPEVQVGDYTIVHVGFALSKLDEASALETLRNFEELGLLLEQELGGPDERGEGP